VGFLNARPLVEGLDADPGFSLIAGTPSALADALHAGELEVAIVPAIEAARGPYRICPDVAIASYGPVRSVKVYHRKPIRRAARIALDPASRSSSALVRVLCAKLWRVAPELVDADGEVDELLETFDAVLRIGDRCLWSEPRNAREIDLGEAWTEMTDLPFVYAVWAGPEGGIDRHAVRRLADARDAGLLRLREIAEAHVAAAVEGRVARASRRGAGLPRRGVARGRDATSTKRDAEVAYRYLKENVRYVLGTAELRGLSRFYELADELRLIPAAPEVRFYGT
jgi:chorismate dehydratase